MQLDELCCTSYQTNNIILRNKKNPSCSKIRVFPKQLCQHHMPYEHQPEPFLADMALRSQA